MKHVLRFARRMLPLVLTLLAMVGSAFLTDWLSPFFWAASGAEFRAALIENTFALLTIVVAAAAFLVTNSDLKGAHIAREKCETFKSALKSVGDDYFGIWKNILSIWAGELDFTASERISVYKHSGSAFLMLGRYSLNPNFAKRGRATYPANQGCIGEAWRSADGSCISNRLPDPTKNLQDYQRAQEQAWNIPRDVTRDLSMKPRVIAAFCVLDATGTQRQAIVVFESTKVRTLNEATLRQYLEQRGASQVVLMMDALKFQEPSLELAKKEGFG